MDVNEHCPNCNSLIPDGQPSVDAGFPFSTRDNIRCIQCPVCQSLLQDNKTADPFTRRLFLTISVVIVLNVMATLAFGSSPIANVMLAIMVASLLIALPLCVFRWAYLKLFQAKLETRYRQIVK